MKAHHTLFEARLPPFRLQTLRDARRGTQTAPRRAACARRLLLTPLKRSRVAVIAAQRQCEGGAVSQRAQRCAK